MLLVCHTTYSTIEHIVVTIQTDFLKLFSRRSDKRVSLSQSMGAVLTGRASCGSGPLDSIPTPSPWGSVFFFSLLEKKPNRIFF
jgi:hypothetical protein